MNKFVLFLINMAVHDCANFNIWKVCPIEYAKKGCNPPLIMGHAIDDSFIPISQAKKVYDVYSNLNKTFIEFANGHNGIRNYHWYHSCYSFIFQRFNIFNVTPTYVNCLSIQQEMHFDNAVDLMNYQENHSEEHCIISDDVIPSLMITEPIEPDSS